MRAKTHTLSEHGRDRIRERSHLSDEEFLHLMNNGGRKRIHTQIVCSLCPREIDMLTEATGLSFLELRAAGEVRFVETFRHYLVWSIPDQKLLTAVVAMPERIVVTVLNALDFTGHDWSDKLTEAAVSEAKSRAIGLTSASADVAYVSVHEAVLFWLDKNGDPRRKVLPKIAFPGGSLSANELSELRVLGRSFLDGGYDGRIVVRDKKNRNNVVFEIDVGPGHAPTES